MNSTNQYALSTSWVKSISLCQLISNQLGLLTLNQLQTLSKNNKMYRATLVRLCFPSTLLLYSFLLESSSSGYISIDQPISISTPPSSPPIRSHPSTTKASFNAASNQPSSTQSLQVEQFTPAPFHTDTSILPVSALNNLSTHTLGENRIARNKQQTEEAPDGLTRPLTRTVSGKRKKIDSDHLLRSNPSLHDLSKSLDKNDSTPKKSPVSPDVSPSRRFWRLMKKISVGGLREKSQSNPAHPPPPVPPLPVDPFFQRKLHTSRSSDSSLAQIESAGGFKTKVTSTSSTAVLASSPTTPLGKVYKTTSLPPTPLSAQPKHSPPHPSSQPPTGPRPSTTTRSSSPSSDVASSQFFNRSYSARSSTSSLGEELPPLPKSPIPTSKTNGKPNANDTTTTTTTRKFQQYIIPPSELSRVHSTSYFPGNDIPKSAPVPIQQPPSMEDDWTIVRSPSVEMEALPLPPPPRQPLKGTGLDRGKGGGQGSKVKKTVNKSSGEVSDGRKEDEKGDEKNTIEENTKSEHEDLAEKGQFHPDHDFGRSPPSPIIPSFSTTSAINSFPPRRGSSSLSPNSRSRGSSSIPVSPSRSNAGSGPGGSSPTANGLSSPSRSPTTPQRSGSRSAFGRVRQHLFGTNHDSANVGEDDEALPPRRKSDVQISHLNQLYSSRYPPPQRQQQPKASPPTHHRHSSGDTSTPIPIAKSRSTHTLATSSMSVPASPNTTALPHRRSMSFHNSLPSLGSFTCAKSSPLPPQPTPPPLSPIVWKTVPPIAASPTPFPSTGHRTRSSSNHRSGFSSKKISEALFSSSSSPASSSASPSGGRPSSASANRSKIGTLMSRSISLGANNHPDSDSNNAPTIPSDASQQPRHQLTDQEKADKWNDLLAKSARAGGTLHLAAGCRLLGSDDI